MSSMKGFNLDNDQLNTLRREHRLAKNKRDADRIKAIYSLALVYYVAT